MKKLLACLSIIVAVCLSSTAFLATPGFGYHPPIAVTGPNQVVYDEVALDGSSSYDTDGTIESYAWVLEGIDNEYDRTAEGPNPTVSDLWRISLQSMNH